MTNSSDIPLSPLSVAPLATPNIAAIARQWIGTPYIHQSSAKGLGADCLGLVTGVLKEAGIKFDEQVPDYSPDWGQASSTEIMLQTAARHFPSVDRSEIEPGDLLVFRWKTGLVAKHAGISVSENTFVHAYDRAGVVENTLNHHWRKKIAGVFRLSHQISGDNH